MNCSERIGQDFYSLETLDVARRLLGCKLMVLRDKLIYSGIIVETEAYLHGDDPASHSFRGMTPRNRVMFGPPGYLYVYTIHNRFCMNVVTQPERNGAAVLLRGIQPVEGLDQMLLNRTGNNSKALKSIDLTNGPGKLCQAFGIDLSFNGGSLIESDSIWIEEAIPPKTFSVATSKRIGISQGVELPYRFFVDGNRYVSGRASDHSRKRTEAFEIADYQ